VSIFGSVRRVLERGVALREETLVEDAIEPSLGEELLRYRPTVVVHRGGNGPSRFARSIEAGARVIETDVRWRDGALVVGHERWVGPVAFDTNRWLLRVDPVAPPLEVVLDEAAEHDCRLMLDLKLGASAHAGSLLEALRSHGLEDKTWFTGDWSALDAIAEASAGRATRHYGVNKPGRLRRFFDEQASAQRAGVSLNKRLATPETLAQLHALELETIVYTVTDPREASQLLMAGADGLITNNLSLVQLFAQQADS
jgi:glycerophosphoryl diester phosphodiesterase